MKKNTLIALLLITLTVMGAMGAEIYRMSEKTANELINGTLDLLVPLENFLLPHFAGEYPGDITHIPELVPFAKDSRAAEDVEREPGDPHKKYEAGNEIAGEVNDEGHVPVEEDEPWTGGLTLGEPFFLDEARKQREKDLIHFLLVGYDREIGRNELVLMVSLDMDDLRARFILIPGHTAVAATVDGEPLNLPIWGLERYGKDTAFLVDMLEELTGIKAGCYMRLNTPALAQMIDMVGGVSYFAAKSFSAGGVSVKRGNNHLDGEHYLALLTGLPLDDYGLYNRKILLRNLLKQADKSVNSAKKLPALLWVGVRNVKTDMSLRDFYRLRQATNAIEPGNFTLEYFDPNRN